MKMGITIDKVSRGQIPLHNAVSVVSSHRWRWTPCYTKPKRSNTSISTKREVVLTDRALSSQYSTKSSRVVMTVTNIEDQFRCFNQNVCFWHQVQIWMYHSAANRPEEMIAIMKLHQFSWNHSKYRNEHIHFFSIQRLIAFARSFTMPVSQLHIDKFGELMQRRHPSSRRWASKVELR